MTETPNRNARRVLWVGVLFFVAATIYFRMTTAVFPSDLSAYLAGAQTFAAGGNPYSHDIFGAESWRGYSFVYPPGALFLMSWLAWIDPTVASILGVLVRFGLLIWTAWLLRPLVGLQDRPLPELVLVSMLFLPVLEDFRWGNIHLVLLAATVTLLHLGMNRREGWHLLACVPIGAVCLFKPHWLIASFGILLLAKRRDLWVGFLAGMGVTATLSVVDLELFRSWLRQVTTPEVVPFDGSLRYWPAAWAMVTLVWTGGLAWLIRKRGLELGLWPYVLTSFLIWPRQGFGTFVVVMPSFLWLADRLPRWATVALGVFVIGPLPWFLRTFDSNVLRIFFGFWTALVAALTLFFLVREARSSRPDDA